MTRRTLDTAIVLIASALCLVLAFGGIDYDVGPVRLRLHDLSRPAILLVVAVGLRWWVSRLTVFQLTLRALAAILVTASVVFLTYHVRVCGGLDSYGYVSAAELVAAGHLSRPQPLVGLLPFDNAPSAAAPLGYIPGPQPQTEVPSFPLGLPLVMAAFRIFGAQGPFFAPLVMAFAAIALSFLIASRSEERGARVAPHAILAGMLAAVLVAVDPIFVDFAIQPMSDVPATCWLLAAIWFASSGSPIAAGMSAGMAFLTRPVLLPAAFLVGVITLNRPRRDAVRFVATLLLFVLGQMLVNLTLYGSVARSGYGRASNIFEISGDRMMANISNFARWMTYSHTPVFWLAWPFALFVLRREKLAWQISLIAAGAAAPYLFYFVFDDWEVPRFLLPAIVLILVLTARSLAPIFRPAPAISVIALVLALACAVGSHRFLSREGVYRLREFESKYAAAGEWVQGHTPERSVVLAALHSGSVRFYGNRETVRWDQIPGGMLSPSLRNLEAAGRELYLLLDTSANEPDLFDERFAQEHGFHIEAIGRVRVVNFYRIMSVR